MQSIPSRLICPDRAPNFNFGIWIVRPMGKCLVIDLRIDCSGNFVKFGWVSRSMPCCIGIIGRRQFCEIWWKPQAHHWLRYLGSHSKLVHSVCEVIVLDPNSLLSVTSLSRTMWLRTILSEHGSHEEHAAHSSFLVDRNHVKTPT